MNRIEKNCLASKKQCCGCTACYSICPADAIQMIEDRIGFEYPVIDNSRCINCHKCVNVCPVLWANK